MNNYNHNNKLFLERASELLLNTGKTQNELVSELGLSNGSIADLKNKKDKTPSAETVCILAKYFNVSTDWLLGLTDELNQDKAKLGAKARVELELNDLECKHEKLSEFIGEMYFETVLNNAEMYLLTEQQMLMYNYIRILKARLSIWRDLDGEVTEI